MNKCNMFRRYDIKMMNIAQEEWYLDQQCYYILYTRVSLMFPFNLFFLK